MKRSFIILFFSFFYSLLFSQNCENYLKKEYCKVLIDKNYKIHPASKAYSISNGESEKFELQVFSGMDYKISLCADEIFGKQLILKLWNQQNELVYDNTDENLSLEFEFSSILDQIIKIEIVVPEGNSGISTMPNYSGCLGVLVQHAMTPRTGF